jgi:hypothetical protein
MFRGATPLALSVPRLICAAALPRARRRKACEGIERVLIASLASHILTGSSPHRGHNVHGIAHRILRESPESVASILEALLSALTTTRRPPRTEEEIEDESNIYGMSEA